MVAPNFIRDAAHKVSVKSKTTLAWNLEADIRVVDIAYYIVLVLRGHRYCSDI